MHIIDCKGLACPRPVINTKKYFDSIENGEAQVIVDNEIAKNNIIKLANSNNIESDVEFENNFFIINLKKLKNIDKKVSEDALVILIGKDKLGDGSDTLGTALMKSYIYALSESDKIPTHLLFLNGGVKLTIEDSEVLESLRVLQDKGVEILSCGTCLDFYGIKEKLAIGEITNMYNIVEVMNSSKNSINL